MTLSRESPLNFLPTELENKQLMLLDSLRFTLEMIDYNFEQLIKHLEQLATGQANKIHYKIFNYAWTLIDHSQRFCLLYKKLNSSEGSIIKRLDYLYSFRNAIQHLDKNVEERIIKNSRPIYGSIKWVVNDVEKNEVYTSILVSGIFNIDNVKFRQHAQAGYNNFINDIKLETDTLKKNDENEINISKLMQDICEITNALDISLKESFESKKLELKDWRSRKDILLNMKNPNII